MPDPLEPIEIPSWEREADRRRPRHRASADHSGGALWPVIRELGGPLVVVAFIVFIVRLDGTVNVLAKAADKLTSAVEHVAELQRAQDRALMRDSVKLEEHERGMREHAERLRRLEEMRRGR